MNLRRVVVEFGKDDLPTLLGCVHIKSGQRALLRAGQYGADGRSGFLGQCDSARA